MKNVFSVFCLLLLSSSLFAAPNRVYFFDGFFVPLPEASMDEALERVQAYLKDKHPGTEYFKIHNSQWEEVCEDLKQMKDKPKSLVLIGHSYGANAAVDIARCLENQPVDLIISLDSFQKFFAGPVDEVPDNVGWNHNFYETISILQGNRAHHRPDGSPRNITNNEVNIEEMGSPHYLVIKTIVDNGIMYKLLDQFLK